MPKNIVSNGNTPLYPIWFLRRNDSYRLMETGSYMCVELIILASGISIISECQNLRQVRSYLFKSSCFFVFFLYSLLFLKTAMSEGEKYQRKQPTRWSFFKRCSEHMFELENLMCSEKQWDRGIMKKLRKNEVFLLPSNPRKLKKASKHIFQRNN